MSWVLEVNREVRELKLKPGDHLAVRGRRRPVVLVRRDSRGNRFVAGTFAFSFVWPFIRAWVVL